MRDLDRRLNRIERQIFGETFDDTKNRLLKEKFPAAKKKDSALKESAFLVQALSQEAETKAKAKK